MEQKTRNWLLIGLSIMIIVIGVGIGVYFALKNNGDNGNGGGDGNGGDNGNGDGGNGNGNGGDGNGGGDSEWYEGFTLDGDLKETLICDGTSNDGNLRCTNKQSCLAAASQWDVDFVKFENQGYGQDNLFGQCSGYNLLVEDEIYKMIALGSCNEMADNKIDDEGLNWNPIHSQSQCQTAITKLYEDNMIIPGGSWWESSRNTASADEGPIQIDKEGDKTYISAYLDRGSAGGAPSHSRIEVKKNADGEVDTFKNDHGVFVRTGSNRPTAGDEFLVPGSGTSSTAPNGCYFNLKYNSLWYNTFNQDDSGKAPSEGNLNILCYAHSGQSMVADPNSNIFYFD